MINNDVETVEEIQEQFTAILSKKPYWSKYTGSQFTDGIATFVAQMVQKNARFSQVRLQEAHISLAANRASILAKAEDKGFVPRKRLPSRGYISISNSANFPMPISGGEELLSPDLTPIMIIEPITIPPNGSADVYIEQLTRVNYGTVIVEDVPYIEIPLTKESTQVLSRLEVWINEPTDGNLVQWDKLHLFRGADQFSKVYTEIYKPTEQLVVRFGNGVSGKIPEVGATVQLHTYNSLGDITLSDGQPFTFVNNALNVNLTAVSILSPDLGEDNIIPAGLTITGGSDWATTEEIRNGAAYSTVFDEQVIWDNDYQHFLNESISDILWVNVWGEYEHEAETGVADTTNINKVFISAYSSSKEQPELETEILALLTERVTALNLRMEYIQSSAIPITFTLNGTTPIHRNTQDVANTLALGLTDTFGEFSSAVGEGIEEKNVWRYVDDTALLDTFSIIPVVPPALKLNEFAFLDVENSTINITHTGAPTTTPPAPRGGK